MQDDETSFVNRIELTQGEALRRIDTVWIINTALIRPLCIYDVANDAWTEFLEVCYSTFELDAGRNYPGWGVLPSGAVLSPSGKKISTASWHHTPVTSHANGANMWFLANSSCFAVLSMAARSAAAPAWTDVSDRYDAANVSATVTSHAIFLPWNNRGTIWTLIGYGTVILSEREANTCRFLLCLYFCSTERGPDCIVQKATPHLFAVTLFADEGPRASTLPPQMQFYLFIYSFVKSMFAANATLVNEVRLMTGPEGH